MELEQWIGRFIRLRDELALAYAERQRNPGRIARLNGDLSESLRGIAETQPADEQCGEMTFSYLLDDTLLNS